MNVKVIGFNDRSVESPLVCAKCGSRLPVSVRVAKGYAKVRCFCKHCRMITEFEIEA